MNEFKKNFEKKRRNWNLKNLLLFLKKIEKIKEHK